MVPEEQLNFQELPLEERPRERLLRYGAGVLSDAELMAIILRTGSKGENILQLSQRLLTQHHGLKGLAHVRLEQLEQIHGLGKAKSAQILAIVELSKRLTAFQPDERQVIHSASDAVKLVLDMGDLPQEHVRVILLDSARRVVAIPTIYIGTLNASVLRVAEIYREALLRNCPALLLVHNHPTGDPTPSPEDVEITRTLIAAGSLLDIQLLDHLIIGRQDWSSLKELGLAF